MGDSSTVAPDAGSDASASDSAPDVADAGHEAEAAAPLTGAYASALVLPDVTIGGGLAYDMSGDVLLGGEFSSTVDINALGYTSNGDLDQIVVKVAPNNGIKWVQTYGGADRDWVYQTALDSAGNGYIAGFVTMATATSSIAFNGQTLAAKHAAMQSMVAKLDATDGHADWVTTFDSTTAGNAECTTLGVNPMNGNVAVACISNANFSFVDTGNVAHTIANGGGMLVVELAASSGNVAQSAYVAGVTTAAGLLYDPAGDLHIVGAIQPATTNVYVPATSTTTAFTITRVGTGNADAFVVKLAGGTWSKQWVTTFGAIGHTVSATGGALDVSGNVFVTGAFNGSCNFGNGALTAIGAADGYIVKVSSSGTELASTSFGGSGSFTNPTNGMGVDSMGNPTVGGTYQSSMGDGITIGSVTMPSSTGEWNGWSAKFSADLKTNLWAQFNVTSATMSSQGLQVEGYAVDPSTGGSGMTGSLIGTVNFDGGPLDAGTVVTRANGLFLLRRAP